MLLLDDYGFLLQQQTIDKMRETQEGRDRLDEIYFSNRAYDAMERICSVLQNVFNLKGEVDHSLKTEIFGCIYDALNASQDEHDGFCLERSEQGGSDC